MEEDASAAEEGGTKAVEDESAAGEVDAVALDKVLLLAAHEKKEMGRIDLADEIENTCKTWTKGGTFNQTASFVWSRLFS